LVKAIEVLLLLDKYKL